MNMRVGIAIAIITALIVIPLSFIGGKIFADNVETSRNASYESVGKTVFTNIAVVGLDQKGLPGYIELTNERGTPYYLWVDQYGKLRIASARAVGTTASPQTVVTGGLDNACSGENGWRPASGQIVGEQMASKYGVSDQGIY